MLSSFMPKNGMLLKRKTINYEFDWTIFPFQTMLSNTVFNFLTIILFSIF
jgi:hypothetical protein